MIDPFSAMSRFTFGTARHSLTHDQHSRQAKIAMVRYAIERGVWVHIGYRHGTPCEILAEAFRERPGNPPKCIGKGLGVTPDVVCNTIEESVKRHGLERFEIVQLETVSDGSALFENGR